MNFFFSKINHFFYNFILHFLFLNTITKFYTFFIEFFIYFFHQLHFIIFIRCRIYIIFWNIIRIIGFIFCLFNFLFGWLKILFYTLILYKLKIFWLTDDISWVFLASFISVSWEITFFGFFSSGGCSVSFGSCSGC